ncbi:MAG: peroxiredoxin [Candidatus Neomarinimicrobiota bacterium]
MEATEFQLLMERFNKGKVEVYGLSADKENSLKKFSYKCNFSFSLLSDPSCKLLKKLGAWGKKKMYGKEYEGIIRSTFVVDKDNVISHIFPKVSVKGHAAEVAKALNV